MNEQALKERLRVIAKSENCTFQEIWKFLVLERLLVRLSRSDYHDKFIFKGGLLLSYFIEIGRETKDADFLITKLNADEENIRKAFQLILNISIKDGFIFSFSDIEKLDQPHMDYPGFRVHLDVKFSKMKDRIQLDIGFGDTVEPKLESLELYRYKGKPIFEGKVSLKVYPIETIFAEKLETVVSKGAINSRMKDFHDLILISREKGLLDRIKLKSDLNKTFANRKTELKIPFKFSDDDYLTLQNLWRSHLKGLGNMASELELQVHIKDIVEEINNYLISNALAKKD